MDPAAAPVEETAAAMPVDMPAEGEVAAEEVAPATDEEAAA